MSVSAAPATASIASASGRLAVAPKQAMAAPQIIVPTSMPRPWRLTRAAGPDSEADSSPPTPTSTLSRPRVRGDPPKCAAFSAGNSATGRPSSMASRSVRNAPTSTGRRRMNRRPSAVARRLDRKGPDRAGPGPAGLEGSRVRMAGSRAVAYGDATKLTASMA